ncbi:DUF4393 domain-containing protein [Bacilliculturomica massiliensis]|uniref:DUF4393 domain-containing protein n=1 Tax=Bacilliculturomica massiliensis TaxID=1917867 RepID=UPI0010300CE6|nr:DUF4393 domain-containing protein [Bacilliculturomica massiliensis]
MDLKFELPQLVNEAFNPLAQAIGNTIRSIWSITFGWIDAESEKLDLKRLRDLEEFKLLLESKVAEIPPGNLKEPDLSIIGPAIESSKYYFDNSELREMFATIISRNMNDTLSYHTHPSFIDVIKQLSTNDAKNLKYLRDHRRCPICRFNGILPSGGSTPLISVAFVRDDQVMTDFLLHENSFSVSNLVRLGIIALDFSVQLLDESKYERLQKSHACSSNITCDKGILEVTPYGREFFLAAIPFA